MEIRLAELSHCSAIFDMLVEIAEDIPLCLDGYERRCRIRELISECVSSGHSRVAIDERNVVRGFLLVKPDEMERFHNNNNALHLCYGGVATAYRRQGIFQTLIQSIMSCRVTLTAIVKAGNRSGMAKILQQEYGFESPLDDGTHYRWQPHRPASSSAFAS